MTLPSKKSYDHLITFTLVLVLIVSFLVYIHGTVAVSQLFYSIKNRGVLGSGARPLHIEGKHVKDDLGNIVYLRGVNRGHFEEDPGGQWGTIAGGMYGTGNYDPDQMKYELDFMAANGINVLRLYERVNFWVDDTPASVVYNGGTAWDGTSAMTHQAIVKDIIEYAATKGIYIVYCPWTMDTSAQVTGKMPWQAGYLNLPQFIDYWVDVVNELKIYDNVLWEFWNEPYGNAQAEWQNGWQQLINAIRGPRTGYDDHVIIVSIGSQFGAYPQYTGPLNWVWDYPINGTDLLYSGHLYWYQPGSGGDSFSFTDGSRAHLYDDVKACITTGGMEALGYPAQNIQPWRLMDSVLNDSKAFWVGEVGPFMGISGELYQQEMEWWTNLLQILNEFGVGYAGWDWQMGAGWRLVDSQWIRGGPIQLSEAGEILVNAIMSAPPPSP